MAFLPAPQDVENIFDKPGATWTPDELLCVVDWLNRRRQLVRLLRHCAHSLGRGTTAQDAEDLWRDYCVRRLDRIITLYDSAKGRRFPSYLQLCLARDCRKQRVRLLKRGRREVPPNRIGQDGEEYEIEAVDTGPDPERTAAEREERRSLLECIARMPAAFREVVVRHHLRDESVREISHALGISEGIVKVRLFRGRLWLRDCLGGARTT